MVGNPGPFDFAGDDRGILCVHGFTSSPWEVRYLGERLAERGYTVVGPTLPGHGTSVDDLDRTTWRDWVAAIAAAHTALRGRCAKVAIVGQSLGGLLALDLATRTPELTAVAALATPLWLEGMSARAARWTGPGGWLHGRLTRIPKIGGVDVADPIAKRESPSYRQVPTRALAELVAFMGVVEGELTAVAAPLLVMHARQDHTAPVACAERIATRARAERTIILDRSYHLIAVDVERDLVAREVDDFFDSHFGAAT